MSIRQDAKEALAPVGTVTGMTPAPPQQYERRCRQRHGQQQRVEQTGDRHVAAV
jgi:hypothetical protein